MFVILLIPNIEHFVSFRNKFDKFTNTGAQILGFIYQMTLKYLEINFARYTCIHTFVYYDDDITMMT